MGKIKDHFKKIGDTKGIFHAKIDKIRHKNSKRFRRGNKDTQNNCTKKLLMSQITTMLWSLT